VHNLYLFCVWLHILAVTAWVGGMFFLALILLPVLRRQGATAPGQFLQMAAGRLRALGWVCLVTLGITGFAQLGFRGMAWNANLLIQAKVLLFFGIVGLSAVHDFWLGPKAGAAMASQPGIPSTLRLRRIALAMGRVTGLLALLMMALGVFIVRGTPQ